MQNDDQQQGNNLQQISNPLHEGGGAGRQLVESSASTGLVSVEQQRAIAEVQARMIVARANPRKPIQAMDQIINDCCRQSLAEVGMYAYSRGGSEISGPSIRLAEAIARRWGNIGSGIKEISRGIDHKGIGYSDCVAYAWDLETGYYDERQYQVRHWRDTKGGGYPLKDERDIYETVANMGQRRKRAVLLTILPGDVVDAAKRQCDITLKSKADTSPEGLTKMLEAFQEYGVTKKQIETRIQRRLDTIQPAQLVGLKKIYASLRDDMSVPGDWFEPEDAGQAEQQTKGSAGLREKVAGKGSTAVADDKKGDAPQDKAPPEAQPAKSEPTQAQADRKASTDKPAGRSRPRPTME